jgi:hypothetical protein
MTYRLNPIEKEVYKMLLRAKVQIVMIAKAFKIAVLLIIHGVFKS